MAENSVIPEDHRVTHHTADELNTTEVVLCNDNSCPYKGQYVINPDKPLMIGDRVVDWEHNARKGYVVGTAPLGTKRGVYVKFDNDPVIRAIFGKCVYADLFVLDNEARNYDDVLDKFVKKPRGY